MVDYNMEKFLICKSNIESLEQEERKISIEKQEQYKIMGEWAEEYYTYEKRIELISYYEKKECTWIVNDLMAIHGKWNSELTYDDIMRFAEYDVNIKVHKEKYTNSKLNKLYSFFFGGE